MGVWEQIGEAFVKQYYNVFDTVGKEALLQFYDPEESCLTFEGNKAQGGQKILELLGSKLQFQKIQHVLTTIDTQPVIPGEGIMILVLGQLQTDEDRPHSFTQTFLLKPKNNSYFVFHDIFRLSLHNA